MRDDSISSVSPEHLVFLAYPSVTVADVSAAEGKRTLFSLFESENEQLHITCGKPHFLAPSMLHLSPALETWGSNAE